jgi:hypothetical protein
LIQSWFSLTCVLNGFSRGLGFPDGYPFLLADAVIRKLRFVHDAISKAASAVAPKES